ncbi:c-type cytochrome [Candidatus Solirubrobacter pratensis]|uniref:c-type cytochrome n=1 Tax=Candidatus Solirubrobacter pratensis TaxID=1298857 RepID=UPI00042024E1|nr:cytochrome c [Candidatus Solirubrobacter pratensis]
MPRARRLLLIAAFSLSATALAGCGEEGISSPPKERAAADIFVQHCSGCHTLKQAGTQGSATDVRTREYKDGPNFNQRTETVNCVLFAIRNGGFSSGPMPQNILTGREAEEVAKYVSENSKPAPTGATAVKIPDCPAG